MKPHAQLNRTRKNVFKVTCVSMGNLRSHVRIGVELKGLYTLTYGPVFTTSAWNPLGLKNATN